MYAVQLARNQGSNSVRADLIAAPTDYYSRYRPGFGTVIASLVVFTCFLHYFFLCAQYYLNKTRIKQ